MTRQEVVANLRALAKVADHHLEDPHGRYFDPLHIMDLFTRATDLMTAVRTAFPSALGDMPVRSIPESSGTSDFDNRGYIHRHEIETVRRDLRYAMDVLDALPPELVNAPSVRAKDQKFGILDVPTLLAEDLRSARGMFGVALVYLDIDHFKGLNTKYTERVIDRTVLPQFQGLIADAVVGHGYAYAEGGDEMVILLPNFSAGMAAAFMADLLDFIRRVPFQVENGTETITVSAGLAIASSIRDLPHLADRANEAKRDAKDQGRDRLVLWRPRAA